MYLTLSVDVEAPAERLWYELADIEAHGSWMRDAARITITSERRLGAGTTAEVVTRLGPVRTTDVMRVTVWDPPRLMGVRHEGTVTGAGLFRIEPRDPGRCRFTWEEELTFPWFLGGPLGERLARPFLLFKWRANLRRLAAQACAATGR